ncbi:MAG: hypothetical protein QM831_25945 [Kofleriaceae bacterium]
MKSLALLFVPAIAFAQPAPRDEPAPAAPVPPAQEPAATQVPAPAPAPATPEPAPVVVTPSPAVEESPSMPRWADPAHHKLEVDFEMFGTAAFTHPGTGDNLSEFRLDRGELGTVVGLGRSFGAELRLESVRSGAEGGALGIDGDSIVVRVKRAQAFGDFEREGLHLHGALGVTPDPWIMALETDYPLRPLSATASERVLGWPTSDLAALGRVAYGPVRFSVQFGNGEGLDYPERNTGKTTTGVIEALPLDTAAGRVRVMGVARDGSVGPARVRDRRFGGAATLWTPLISAGGELVKAYGIGDRGDLEALALAGWAELRPHALFALDGRFTTVGYADGGGRASSIGGAVAVEPWRENKNRVHGHSRETDGVLRLWLALDRTTTSGGAMPIAGALSGDATTLLLIVSTTAPYTVD